MSEGQKILMLTENYNIYKILDNTILGFFVGLISGIGIEAFMNVESNLLKDIIFIILCIISTTLILVAMSINSKFIQKCQDIVLLQTEYQNRQQLFTKLTKDSYNLQLKFKLIFWCAIFVLFIGIIILKFPFLQNYSNISNQPSLCYIIHHCKLNNSIQFTATDSIRNYNIDTLVGYFGKSIPPVSVKVYHLFRQK